MSPAEHEDCASISCGTWGLVGVEPDAPVLTEDSRIADFGPPGGSVVGGGAQNALLCQLTADACGLTVLAGPVEATALGNVVTQARAAGVLTGAGGRRGN